MKFNRVQLIGRLTADPEIKDIIWNDEGKDTPGVVTTFTLAVSRYKKDITDFFQVQLYNGKGKRAHEYLRKGSLVLVEGSIQLDRVEQDHKGIKFTNTYTTIKATEFQSLEKKPVKVA